MQLLSHIGLIVTSVYFERKKTRKNQFWRKILAVCLKAIWTRPWQTFSPYKHIPFPIEKQIEAF